QVQDGALVGREFSHGVGKGGAEGGFIGVSGGSENGQGFGGEVFGGLVTGGAAADEVDSGIMGEADEEMAFVAGVFQEVGLAGELDEDLLEEVAGIVFVAGEIEQEGKQRLGVLVVQPFDVGGHCF